MCVCVCGGGAEPGCSWWSTVRPPDVRRLSRVIRGSRLTRGLEGRGRCTALSNLPRNQSRHTRQPPRVAVLLASERRASQSSSRTTSDRCNSVTGAIYTWATTHVDSQLTDELPIILPFIAGPELFPISSLFRVIVCIYLHRL